MSRWKNTSSRTKTGYHEYVLSESTYSVNTSVKNVGNISNIETQKIYGKLDISNSWTGNTNNTGLEIISPAVNFIHPTDNTSTTRLSIQNGKTLMGYRNETDVSGAFIEGGPGEKVILYNRDSGDSQNNNINISRALVIDNDGNIAIHAEQSSDISFDLFINGNVRILGELELDSSSTIISHDEISGNIRVGRSLFVFGDDGTGTMTNSLGNTIDTSAIYQDHQLGSDWGELWVTNDATLLANLTVSGDIYTDASAVINGKLWVGLVPEPSPYSLIVGSDGLNVNGEAVIAGNILGKTITAYGNLVCDENIYPIYKIRNIYNTQEDANNNETNTSFLKNVDFNPKIYSTYHISNNINNMYFDYPFNEAGNLIIQPSSRLSYPGNGNGRDIILATGYTTDLKERLIVDRNGNTIIKNGKLWVGLVPEPSPYSLIVGSDGLNVNGEAVIDGNILGQTITAYGNLVCDENIYPIYKIRNIYNTQEDASNNETNTSFLKNVDFNSKIYSTYHISNNINNMYFDYPFNEAGNLIIQPSSRLSYPGNGNGRDIILATGYTTDLKERLIVDRNGNTIIKNGNLFVYSDITATGTVTANSFITTSDVNLKENIVPINNSNALKLVSLFKPYEFNFKSDEHKRKRIGVIAQELEKISPELVIENDNGIKSVSYLDMIGLLIASVKELKERIEVLENKSS